jgi:predicted dehydrogenase
VFARPRFADAVIITTQDSMHVGPAVAAARAGYHILLEKPMAVTPEDCKAIVAAVKAAGVRLAVGHVLRYTPYMQKIIGLLRSGAIGDVINIQHLEPIGHFHYAHSYVRGNWRKEAESSSMLLAKCCHDVDLLRYMVGKPCSAVSSFGALTHFKPANAPAGATARCLDCPVERDCAFSAKKIYLERAQAGHFGWPVGVILDGEPTVANVEAALRSGPYGRCVYACDNDVNDHQVVSLQFEGGTTATLTTVAFTEAICQRRTRIFGTKGELDCDGEATIRQFDFLTSAVTVHAAEAPPAGTALRGHNGADYFLIKGFIEAIASGDGGSIVSGPDETLESHLMVFAAEQARHAKAVVPLSEAETGVALSARDFSW